MGAPCVSVILPPMSCVLAETKIVIIMAAISAALFKNIFFIVVVNKKVVANSL
jgi:hypothetical protein